MTKEMIIAAYCKIRTINNSIADDVLDFMKDAAIEKLKSLPVEYSDPRDNPLIGEDDSWIHNV